MNHDAPRVRLSADNKPVPHLHCPGCGNPLVPAGRGRNDKNGDYIAHRDSCCCRWCDWMWVEDPGHCHLCGICGTVSRVRCDDGHAYLREVELQWELQWEAARRFKNEDHIFALREQVAELERLLEEERNKKCSE